MRLLDIRCARFFAKGCKLPEVATLVEKKRNLIAYEVSNNEL